MTSMIVLRGGPMHGWVVPPTALVLRPGWRPPQPSGFMARLRRRTAPVGQYVVHGRYATWFEERPAAEASFRPLALFVLAVLGVIALLNGHAAGGALAINIGQVFLELLADGARFKQSVEKEAAEAGERGAKTLSQKLSEGLTKAGKAMTSAGKTLTKNVTAPIVGLGAAVFKVGVEFDTTLRQIVALTDVTTDEIGDVREAVLGLAGETGRAPQELAESFYFLASAGLDTKTALDSLPIVAKSSAAGMGEASDIAKVLTGVINAYGKENITAARAVDILTAAVGMGSAEAADFASSIGPVIPIAATLGVTFDQVAAAMAGMTNVGIDADTAATSLKNVLTSLLKPTKEAEKALEEMGLSSAGLRTELREKGLLSVLRTLQDRFEGNDTAIGQVFGNVRALTAVTALLGLSQEQLTKLFGGTIDSLGDLDQAYRDTEGPQREFDRAMVSINATLIRLSNDVLPVVTEVLREVTGLISTVAGAFTSLPEPVRAVIVRVLAFAAAVGPLVFVVGKLTSGIGLLIGAFTKLKAIATVAGPALASALSGLSASPAVTRAVGGLGKILGTTLGKAASVAFAAVLAVEAVRVWNEVKDQLDAQGRELSENAASFAQTATREQLEAALASAEAGLMDLKRIQGLTLSLGPLAPILLDSTSGAERGLRETINSLKRQLAEGATGAGGSVGAAAGAAAAAGLAVGMRGGEEEVEAAAAGLTAAAAAEIGRLASTARNIGRATPQELADGILASRAKPLDAFERLIELMKEPLSRTREVARLMGQLTSEELAAGIKSKDPAVRAQAIATRDYIVERLRELKVRTGILSKGAAADLVAGLNSKDPEIRAAAWDIYNMVYGPLAGLGRTASTLGANIGAQFAKGLTSKVSAAATAAAALARAVASYTRVNSPAEKGPLSLNGGPEGWGRRTGHLWGKGLASELPDVGRMLSMPNVPRGVSASGSVAGVSPAPSTTNIGGSTVNIPVTVQGLVRATTPFEVATQMRRAAEVGLLARELEVRR